GAVSFILGKYDRRTAVIIDPAVVYRTALGGSGLDEARGIAVDPSGDFYVTGSTQSPDFPVQSGYSSSNSGDYDVFVTKFAPSGTSLIYSTYIGGSGADY